MVKDRKLVQTNAANPKSSSPSSINAAGSGGFNNNPIFFALKVQKSAEHYTEAAMDEVELLDCIAQERKKCEGVLVSQGPMSRDSNGIRAIDNVDHARHVATLHDSFFHNGPHGRHMAMVFGMLGCNLLSVIKAFNYRGIPIPAVKRMIKGVCKGLDFLHRRCQIIHTDLKPENILLQFPDTICPPSLLLDYDGEGDGNDDGDEHANKDNDEDDDTAGTGGQQQQEGMSIPELEEAIKDPKLSSDERKKLKKRLKKKRQKERRKLANREDQSNEGTSVEDDEDFDAQSISSDMETEAAFLKDREDTAAKATEINGSANNTKSDDTPTANKFVARNFISPPSSTSSGDEQTASIMNDTVVLTEAGHAQVEAHLGACGSLMRRQHRVDGVAEVTFLMRVNGTEEELAEMVSGALDGIKWADEGGLSGTKVW